MFINSIHLPVVTLIIKMARITQSGSADQAPQNNPRRVISDFRDHYTRFQAPKDIRRQIKSGELSLYEPDIYNLLKYEAAKAQKDPETGEERIDFEASVDGGTVLLDELFLRGVLKNWYMGARSKLFDFTGQPGILEAIVEGIDANKLVREIANSKAPSDDSGYEDIARAQKQFVSLHTTLSAYSRAQSPEKQMISREVIRRMAVPIIDARVDASDTSSPSEWKKLFQNWAQRSFGYPLSIFRTEVMKAKEAFEEQLTSLDESQIRGYYSRIAFEHLGRNSEKLLDKFYVLTG